MTEDRFVGMKEAQGILNLSKVTIWRMERDGILPKRYLISTRRKAYKLSELMEWMNNRSTANAA